jgi:phosphatidylglycerophosphate synthase
MSAHAAPLAANHRFQDATRELHGLTAGLERRCLIYLAGRLPVWVTSDHLTLLALVAMLLAGICYALAGAAPSLLLLVNLWLAVNWFGDSLDGTLARVRRQQRPRYGFYVDHAIDAWGILFLIGGLAISGIMTSRIALTLLVAYFLLSIQIYLATYCLGRFQISFFRLGPTELRLLLALGNCWVYLRPTTTWFGYELRPFDLGGAIAIAGLLLTAAVSVVRDGRRLHRLDPRPPWNPAH